MPSAVIVHDEGAAAGGGGKRTEQPAYRYDSWRHYHQVTSGRVRALVTAVLMVPAALTNLVARRLRGQRPDLPRRFFRNHWRLVIWPLLGGRQV